MPTRKNKNINPFVIQSGRIKKGKLGNVYRRKWTEEIFDPALGEKETIGKNLSTNNLVFLGVCLLLFLFTLAGRVAWLQVVKGEYYYELAEDNRIRIERIEPKRGVVYDRNYNALVINVANFMLYFVPADLPEDESRLSEMINRISDLLEVEPDKIYSILSQVSLGSLEAYQPLFVADNIEYEKAMKLYLESENMPGVVLSNRTRRLYSISSKSASHLLGYTGKINQEELEKYGQEYLPIDYIGKMGIEFFWENELKGVGGKRFIEVDALLKQKKVISEEKSMDGFNLVLSLDMELQKKLEETIQKSLDKLKLTKGMGIALDPNNGEVLAMVSLPAYNNNVFARGIRTEEYAALINDPDKPLFNRVVSGEYPSGSTIKPVIAAAALEEGVISEHTSFLSTGGIRIGQWFFPDWRAGGHGSTNVRKAISDSVNTFFYYIGGGYNDFQGLGVDRIVKYCKEFGLGEQTGIDLAGEVDGFLPSREWKEAVKGERWYIGDTYHLAIGQGDILVTPLQVAMFTSVFANGGDLYRPHLVKQILSSDDRVVKNIETEPVKSEFISDYNIEVVRQGMNKTTTQGSARSLQAIGVSSAGKTGTAQWSSKKDPHAWFTSFAPYDDPEIVLTIMIEEGDEGSSTAVPIAKEVLDWYFNSR